jgi:YVTN family beta-propeller protein
VTQAVGVTASISVGIGPQGIAYDSAKDEIFVANSYNNTVSVILDNSKTILANVTVGDNPFGVLMIRRRAKSS